jgi:putative membrane protein
LGNYGMFGFGGQGWIFMILWWVLILVAIVALVRWFLSSSSSRRDAGGRSAMDILKERYARREIDREEYEQKRHDLQH